MIITIGSGKGGTGKTTIATSLALSLARHKMPTTLIDCDVEEPNANVFMRASVDTSEEVRVLEPVVDEELCTHCGKCQDFCRFNALAVLPDKVLTFPEMCHACTGCIRVCPVGAISKGERSIGTVDLGSAGDIRFAQGRINIGEARSVPVIARLKADVDPDVTTIFDAPPGTSCPFVETVKGSDICVLVTEPTPFGLHDLKLAVETLEYIGIPFGVVINKSDLGDDGVERYCADRKIEIWLKVPHERSIAEAYATGQTLVESKPQYEKEFMAMYSELVKRIEANE